MVVLDRLLGDVKDACAAFPDKRKSGGGYTMAVRRDNQDESPATIRMRVRRFGPYEGRT
jgi:hypothetical protein